MLLECRVAWGFLRARSETPCYCSFRHELRGWDGEDGMDRFVARENIKHYRQLLASENDEEKRRYFLALIEEEEAKLKAAEERAKREPPGGG